MTDAKHSIEEGGAETHLKNPLVVFLVAMLLGGGLLQYTSLAAMQQRIINLEDRFRAALPIQDNEETESPPPPKFDL